MTTLGGAYDAVLLDLDGTVYRGGMAVPGSADAVARLRRDGTGVVFVTNNASRSPVQVAEHLTGLGVTATADEVATSAQAATRVLTGRLASSDRVLVVGTTALADQVAAAGLEPVRDATARPAAVVQGLSQDTGWRDLAQACLAIRAGALWVACNIDSTLPTEDGLLPGNGAMVAALRVATGAEPVVAGKPARPLVDEAVSRAGGRSPLLVGDRLDTDIAGAHAAGVDSLLVLTGVTDPAALLAAPVDRRPTHLAHDLTGLAATTEQLRIGERPGWTCERAGDELVLLGSGDPLDALRALCAHRWSDGTGPVVVTAADTGARDAIRALGLAGPR